MEFRYNCTNPDSVEDLEKLIDNSVEITNEQFRKIVGDEAIIDALMSSGWWSRAYIDDFLHDCECFESSLRGSRHYYFTHSMVEFIFSEEAV